VHAQVRTKQSKLREIQVTGFAYKKKADYGKAFHLSPSFYLLIRYSDHRCTDLIGLIHQAAMAGQGTFYTSGNSSSGLDSRVTGGSSVSLRRFWAQIPGLIILYKLENGPRFSLVFSRPFRANENRIRAGSSHYLISHSI